MFKDQFSNGIKMEEGEDFDRPGLELLSLDKLKEIAFDYEISGEPRSSKKSMIENFKINLGEERAMEIAEEEYGLVREELEEAKGYNWREILLMIKDDKLPINRSIEFYGYFREKLKKHLTTVYLIYYYFQDGAIWDEVIYSEYESLVKEIYVENCDDYASNHVGAAVYANYITNDKKVSEFMIPDGIANEYPIYENLYWKGWM